MSKARELSELGDNVAVSGSNVGINNSTPNYNLDVNGSFRTTYVAPTYTSSSGSQNTSDHWWKLGHVNALAASRSLRLTVLGTNSYSAGGQVSGQTTILFRGNNASTTVEGTFWSDTEGLSHISSIGWKYLSADSFEIYVKFTNGYAGLDIYAETSGQWYNDVSDTGASTTPAGVVVESSKRIMYAGYVPTLALTATETVVNDASYDHDFRVESGTNTHALFVNAGGNSVQVGKESPSCNGGFGSNTPLQMGDGWQQFNKMITSGGSRTITFTGSTSYMVEITYTTIGNYGGEQIAQSRWVAGRRDSTSFAHLVNSADIIGTAADITYTTSDSGDTRTYTLTLDNGSTGANVFHMIEFKAWGNVGSITF